MVNVNPLDFKSSQPIVSSDYICTTYKTYHIKKTKTKVEKSNEFKLHRGNLLSKLEDNK